MKTIEQIRAGRVIAVLKADGNAYLMDVAETYAKGFLVATSAAGLTAVAEALLELAKKRREMREPDAGTVIRGPKEGA